MTDDPGRDPAHERLRALLAPNQCAVLLQELQEGVVGATSGLPALADAVQQSALSATRRGSLPRHAESASRSFTARRRVSRGDSAAIPMPDCLLRPGRAV
jgi:hypothetical protein